MASTPDTPDPLQPMTVGNVVNTGFRLYSSNLKPYLTVAAIATGWALVPWVVLAPIVFFYATAQRFYSLLGLIIPAWFVLLLVCSTYYLANAAAIARLAFTELTNRPESPHESRRYTRSRRWSFLLLSVLIGLIFFGISIVMYILAALCVVAIFAAMGGAEFLRNPTSAALVNPTLIVLTVLIVLSVIAIFLLMILWLGVRFGIADLPLAMEPGIAATDGIGRSWELTRGNVWRLVLIFTVTGLITLPIQVLVQLVVGLAQEASTLLVAENSFGFVAISYLFTTIFGLLSGIVLLPLWQSMKAVIYYDLRSRREGLDLELRDWGDRLPPSDAHEIL